MESTHEINLSRMFELPKCAVHCSTLEDARLLVRAMKEKHPEMARGFNDADCGWENKNTCYTLFYERSRRAERLSRTNIEWFHRKGYEVIELDELIVNIVDIDESEASLDVLFG